MKILEDIINYKPYNEQEEHDKELIISFLKNNKNAFSRENTLAHMTASSWICNKERTKVLMVYHNIYDSWSWTGGHADGEENLLEVALKEAKEETHIVNIKAISESIFSLESLTVDGHIKKGKYVSSHIHLNVTYLLEADENDEISPLLEENKGVKWIDVDDVQNQVTEVWFNEHIYNKLNKKLSKI